VGKIGVSQISIITNVRPVLKKQSATVWLNLGKSYRLESGPMRRYGESPNTGTQIQVR
jgi:hypothetical protein